MSWSRPSGGRPSVDIGVATPSSSAASTASGATTFSPLAAIEHRDHAFGDVEISREDAAVGQDRLGPGGARRSAAISAL